MFNTPIRLGIYLFRNNCGLSGFCDIFAAPGASGFNIFDFNTETFIQCNKYNVNRKNWISSKNVNNLADFQSVSFDYMKV